MSDIRKWLKIMESFPPTLLNQEPKTVVIKQDATVMIAPQVGGGTGRYMHSTPQGAMIDIKGVAREMRQDDFSLPNHDYEDPYKNGNTWDHNSNQSDTVGSMRDKPELRPGDMVKIEDVYGTVIGPGFGVFVGYGTSGQDCIVSFDNKEIIVPIANVGAALEQDAKDSFNQMDNDGNLSPMSFGSENVKIQKEPEMDQRDEFSKWISAVEEALSGESKTLAEDTPGESDCDCGKWNCTTCFPDEHKAHEKEEGKEFANKIASAKNDIEMDDLSEEPEEAPKSKGVKLGDIVKTTKTEFRKAGGQESPLTYGDDNLDENPDNMDFDGAEEMEMGSPLSRRDAQSEMSHIDPEEAMNLTSAIMNMQNSGFSNSNQEYTEDDLANMTADQLRQVHSQVTGDVSEETDGMDSKKPTKVKKHNPLDDLEDMLGGGQNHPLAPMGGDEPSHDSAAAPMSLPAAGRERTQSKLRGMTPSDTMRDYMSRINPEAGAEEPEFPEEPGTELTARTASDVPAVISNAMQAAGTVSPEWHHIRDLPGFGNKNIRGMGRSVFGMFTSTPVQDIQTIANVDGQGPNTEAELRAVASWLRNNAEDLGDIDVSHGMAIPGYQPDVKEFRANGVRFHVVRDPMGQYIYAYPDKDARLHGGPADGGQGQLGASGNMPRLGESINALVGKPTLFEQIKFDQELEEAFIEESSLSKLIGKQKGGQKLVQWLHRKHKLGNMADMQPQPFSERMLWKEFKSNPDNFVVVSATNGVAGIKPYEKMIKDRMEAARKKGKEYNPGGDSTLQYQIVAFTDDGQQVDPALLQPAREPGEEREVDPTVMKARMGKINGRDMQNPDNVFNLLADQIGSLRTVYLAPHAVERDKMTKRADMKKGPADMDDNVAMQQIFKRVRPVLKTLGMQALSQINNRAKRYIEGGNFEAATKISQSGAKLKQFLATIDTSGEINLDRNYGSNMKSFSDQIAKAIADASGSRPGQSEFKEFLNRAASGSAMELKPVLDALRDNLVALT